MVLPARSPYQIFPTPRVGPAPAHIKYIEAMHRKHICRIGLAYPSPGFGICENRMSFVTMGYAAGRIDNHDGYVGNHSRAAAASGHPRPAPPDQPRRRITDPGAAGRR